MAGVSAAGGEVSREKQRGRKGKGRKEHLEMIWSALNSFNVQRVVWLLFKSVPAVWHLSFSSRSSVLGSAGVSLGILFPKDMRESPAKFCTPQTLPDLMFPSLPSTEVPDLAPSATPPTIWSSCLLQSSRTIAQNLRMGYICISSDYCCLLFLDFH